MSSPSVRSELVQSAVNFLQNPQVQNSPLQKRIAFLESKGLTANEIEEAIKLAKGGSGDLQQVPTSMGNMRVAPVPPRLDWRDFFVAAVLIGGISYAIRYILPLLKTPTAKELERDKQSLTDQFTMTSETLDVVKADTKSVKKIIDEQSLKVRESLERLDNTLKDLEIQEGKRDTEIKTLKEEIDTIRDLIPKTKESQAQSLADLQNELKSLKSLIANRRFNTSISPVNDALTNSSSTLPPSSPTVNNNNNISSSTKSPPPNTNLTTASTISSTIPSISSISSASGRSGIPPWQLGTNTSSSSTGTVVEQKDKD
ncbi:193_t:CDS:2 [Diversispora eburnea]|uniref:Peroxisomal membrane protein PEX14 n=1 Tax=Diversispora eburnea TaxID=1213867 RepID=A0A9N8WIX1_9GLOM|nr:193_t:CDS:2 [Diversispora eburnea]